MLFDTDVNTTFIFVLDSLMEVMEVASHFKTPFAAFSTIVVASF